MYNIKIGSIVHLLPYDKIQHRQSNLNKALWESVYNKDLKVIGIYGEYKYTIFIVQTKSGDMFYIKSYWIDKNWLENNSQNKYKFKAGDEVIYKNLRGGKILRGEILKGYYQQGIKYSVRFLDGTKSGIPERYLTLNPNNSNESKAKIPVHIGDYVYVQTYVRKEIKEVVPGNIQTLRNNYVAKLYYPHLYNGNIIETAIAEYDQSTGKFNLRCRKIGVIVNNRVIYQNGGYDNVSSLNYIKYNKADCFVYITKIYPLECFMFDDIECNSPIEAPFYSK